LFLLICIRKDFLYFIIYTYLMYYLEK